MKLSLFLSSIWLFLASLFTTTEPNTFLTGLVTDGTEPLIGATIKVMKGTSFVRGTVTDYNGEYRLNLDPGTYDLEVSFTGFKAVKITGVKVLAGVTTKQDVTLSNAEVLNEVIVKDYKVPLIEQDQTSSGQTLTPEQIKELPTRSVKEIISTTVGSGSSDKKAKSNPSASEAPKGKAKTAAPATKPEVATTVGAVSTDGGDVNMKGSRGEVPVYYIDGIRVSGGIPPVEDISYDALSIPVDAKLDMALTTEEPAMAAGLIQQPAPRAGLLTAGEWNDLHNWNHHWLDILADGEADSYQLMYQFYPKQRYAILVTNDNGFPVADAPVLLKDKADQVLWQARTDNTGKAELWAGLYTVDKTEGPLRAEVLVDGRNYELKNLKQAKNGFNTLKINTPCQAPKNVDIFWVVDATGSMGDEIEYLKTELLDVIGRAKSRNTELNYRMGTVFYRDNGDEYLTRSSELSPDINQTVSFIQKQYAGGGGDYPEAVHSALDEAIFKQKWSENAIARICFLVLDASPHQGEEINKSLQRSIQEAARLGIRIVPIAASGIQKDTEFLMKFFGLATNGSYVFLTDHSGIGGKHIEPTTDEYKVEPLNNLIVRIITEYTTVETCEGKSEIRFENDPQQQPGPVMQALYYPNPAVDQFTLELPFEVQSVTIYDAEGKAVHKLENLSGGQHRIALQGWAAGFYTIRILNNGMMQSGKLMVVKG